LLIKTLSVLFIFLPVIIQYLNSTHKCNDFVVKRWANCGI